MKYLVGFLIIYPIVVYLALCIFRINKIREEEDNQGDKGPPS